MFALDDFFSLILRKVKHSKQLQKLLKSKHKLVIFLVTRQKKHHIKFLTHPSDKLDDDKRTKAEIQGKGTAIKKALHAYHKQKQEEQYMCDEIGGMHYVSDWMGTEENTRDYAKEYPNIPVADVSDYDIIKYLNENQVYLFNLIDMEEYRQQVKEDKKMDKDIKEGKGIELHDSDLPF